MKKGEKKKQSSASDFSNDFSPDQKTSLIDKSNMYDEEVAKPQSQSFKIHRDTIKRKKKRNTSFPWLPCILVTFYLSVSVLAAVLSMVKSYFLIGFIYSLLMISIGFFIFACDKIYSTPLYQGIWCNVCCCLQEGIARTIFSVIFKIVLVLLMLLTMTISGVQITNIIKDPKWEQFPIACSPDSQQDTYCVRVASTVPMNSEQITNNYPTTFNMQNGLIDLKSQIYHCLTTQFQLRISDYKDDIILGNQADYQVGFAYDFAINIQKCQGITFQVNYQAESRIPLDYQNRFVDMMAENFYKCLGSRIDEEYYEKRESCVLATSTL